MKMVSSTELQNNFGKYLKEVQNGEEIMILKSGKTVARLISEESNRHFLSDELAGLLREDIDYERALDEAFKDKYGLTD